MGIKVQLIDGKAKVGVWGCGYIGFTTMINYAKEGIYCVGYDADSSVVEKIIRGELHIPNLDYWIGYHIGELVGKMAYVTDNYKDMMAGDVKVHFIAVPTEMNGEPYFEPLRDVMDKISQKKIVKGNPDLIIIESTLTPGMFDIEVLGTLERNGFDIGKDVMVGIAPRRDWFDSPEKNLKALNRVIGGTTGNTTQAMKEVLGIVCDNLIPSDAETAELVKSVENSIFHICAVYACQLADAYPDVNIAEVLRLASTHWRIPLYFPSVGTGGYCIPVASKYVLGGAAQPQNLTLTREVIRFDADRPDKIAEMMASKVGKGSIGVLGLSYKKDLKVHIMSPSLRIIKGLKDRGIGVKAYDPYYEGMETYQLTDVMSFKYPDGLGEFGGLIIVPPHRVFNQTPKSELLRYIKKGTHILDNEGVWEKWRGDFVKSGIDYHKVGDKGWTSI